MLLKTSELQRHIMEGTDGELGTISDIYFYKGQWLIRYLLLNASFETMEHGILISTYDVREIRHDKYVVKVNLDQQQIRNSPETDLSQPISRQHEVELLQYYGWPTDWLQEEHDINPVGELSGELQHQQAEEDENTGPELQSFNEIFDFFRIQANDAEIGRITDFIVNEETWLIEYAAAQFAGSPTGYVLLAVDMIERVDWIEGHFYADASLDTIKGAPPYNPSESLSKEQIKRVQIYYGGQ